MLRRPEKARPGQRVGRWATVKPWTQRGGYALMTFDTGKRNERNAYRWVVWRLKPKQVKVASGSADSPVDAERAAQEFIANERSH